MAITNTASGAIANWSTSNPATASFNCNGADILFVGVFTNGAVTAVSATYNGVSMTQLAYFTDAGSNDQAVFYLVNPASGSNTLSVSRTGGSNLSVAASAYAGVDTSDPIDAYVTDAGTASNVSSYTTSSVTVGDAGNWLIGIVRDADNKTASNDKLSVRAGTTTVIEEIWDSNGAIGTTGSHAVTYTLSTPGGKVQGHTLISLQVASAASTFIPRISFIM